MAVIKSGAVRVSCCLAPGLECGAGWEEDWEEAYTMSDSNEMGMEGGRKGVGKIKQQRMLGRLDRIARMRSHGHEYA